MKKAIVVGSGAGGAMVAKELQGHFDVTILEAGGPFRRLTLDMPLLERIKSARLLFDERETNLIFGNMQVRKSSDGMIMVNGLGVGGTTTISTGNALRMDAPLREIGVDLDTEFEEIFSEIPTSTGHRRRWRPATKAMFEICDKAGMNPVPTPKMGDYERCGGCGRCILGCPNSVKWDSRQFVAEAVTKGARLLTGCRVRRIVADNGRVKGVIARVGLKHQFFAADLVVLAAGGFATPVILHESGITCESQLFVDPVLCVATEWEDALQSREVPMPFVVQREGYIISPYFDYLSFLFNKSWSLSSKNILGLMIKLADTETGRITGRKIHKSLTTGDQNTLAIAVEECREILSQLGVHPSKTFLGTLNAGHPGGMLPLTKESAEALHDRRLPRNLYIADATLLPKSLGNPPILTVAALAKRVARKSLEQLS